MIVTDEQLSKCNKKNSERYSPEWLLNQWVQGNFKHSEIFHKSTKKPKEEYIWMETELKYPAVILADEKTICHSTGKTCLQAMKTLKISKNFNELMLSNLFKEENEQEQRRATTPIEEPYKHTMMHQ